jgi:hypothetical protein
MRPPEMVIKVNITKTVIPNKSNKKNLIKNEQLIKSKLTKQKMTKENELDSLNKKNVIFQAILLSNLI